MFQLWNRKQCSWSFFPVFLVSFLLWITLPLSQDFHGVRVHRVSAEKGGPSLSLNQDTARSSISPVSLTNVSFSVPHEQTISQRSKEEENGSKVAKGKMTREGEGDEKPRTNLFFHRRRDTEVVEQMKGSMYPSFFQEELEAMKEVKEERCVNGGVLPSLLSSTWVPPNPFAFMDPWMSGPRQEWREKRYTDLRWNANHSSDSFPHPLRKHTEEEEEVQCICPLSYIGKTCSVRQCPHSVGGVGPFHILPTNDTTMFCDHCEANLFTGINCQMCMKDEACAVTAGSAEEEGSQGTKHCHRGMRIQGNEKQFQCSLASPYFLQLMGEGRNVTADILLNWTTTDGKAFGTENNGKGFMTLYRREPENRYIDPFFRCEASLCSYTIVEASEDEEDADERGGMWLVRGRQWWKKKKKWAKKPVKRVGHTPSLSRRRNPANAQQRTPEKYSSALATASSVSTGRQWWRRWWDGISSSSSSTHRNHFIHENEIQGEGEGNVAPRRTAWEKGGVPFRAGPTTAMSGATTAPSTFIPLHLGTAGTKEPPALKEEEEDGDDDEDEEDDDEETKVGSKKESLRLRMLHLGRILGQLVLLLLCVGLTLLGSGVAGSVLGPKRRRHWTIRLSVSLLLLTFFYVMTLTLTIHPAHMSRKIRYQCQEVHCACAEDPPEEYQPICSQSPVLRDVVLPSLQHSFEVMCEMSSPNSEPQEHRRALYAENGGLGHPQGDHCQLTLEDLNLVFHTYCNASECVDNKRFPPFKDETRGDEREEEDEDQEDNNTDKGGKRGVPQRMTILRVLVYLVLGTGTCISIHALFLCFQSRRLREEFRLLFHTSSRTLPIMSSSAAGGEVRKGILKKSKSTPSHETTEKDAETARSPLSSTLVGSMEVGHANLSPTTAEDDDHHHASTSVWSVVRPPPTASSSSQEGYPAVATTTTEEDEEASTATAATPSGSHRSRHHPSHVVAVHFDTTTSLAGPSSAPPAAGVEVTATTGEGAAPRRKEKQKKKGTRRGEEGQRRIPYPPYSSSMEEDSTEEVVEDEQTRLLPSFRVQQTITEAHRLSSAPMMLEAEALSYTLPTSRFREETEGKTILHHIHFSAKSGEVVAIMGPSGAGKSTLLDIISTRAKVGRVNGALRVNGTSLMDSDTTHSTVMASETSAEKETKGKRSPRGKEWNGMEEEQRKREDPSHRTVDPASRGGEETKEEGRKAKEVPIGSSRDPPEVKEREDGSEGHQVAVPPAVPPPSSSFFSSLFPSAASPSSHRTPNASLRGTTATTSKTHASLALLRQQYRNLIGYVSQQDTLLPALTVRQTIYYAARLKLPSVFSPRVLHHIIEEIIDTLKLQQCADTIIGDEGGKMMRGISGGERRRVSIAVELLSNPRILLLDEPTSGLDSVSAQTVMEAVANVAKHSPMRRYAPYYFAFQPIVMFSIHQPSSDIYKLFDQVILLSRGYSVYSGPAAVAPTIFLQRVQAGLVWLSSYKGSDEEEAVLTQENEGEGDRRKEKGNGGKTGVTIHRTSARRHCVEGTTRTPSIHQEAETVRVLPYSEEQNPAEYLLRMENKLTASLRPWLSHHAVMDSSSALGQPFSDPVGGDTLVHPHTLSTTTTRMVATVGENVGESDRWMVPGEELLPYTSALRRYYANVYQQLDILICRSADCLLGSYGLIACHAGVVVCLSLLLCGVYQGQSLDLPGALNRAGCITFLLLVTSFMSISGLEALLEERLLFLEERENGFYASIPYFMSKLVVDMIPFRVLPSMVLGTIIYFPMGFRVDQGWSYFYFISILVLFSADITLMTMCIGILASSFGTAALLSSVMILLNFVFGGAMVQAGTLPSLFQMVQRLSPFFLAFEALMVNELDGQACTFSPTDETGKPSASFPIQCRQYLANEGLRPSRWSGDIIQLCLYSVFFVIVAVLLMSYWTKLVR